jgi:predicted transcriptional regulator
MSKTPRTTVYFNADTTHRLDRIARYHRRSRSNLLALLIEQEYARLFEEAPADAPAASQDGPGRD